MVERMGPVHAPGIADLRDGDYVAHGSCTAPGAWEAWLRGHLQAPCPRSLRMLDHHFLMIEATLGGLGTALVHWCLCDGVVRGRLPTLFSFDSDDADYGLIAPGNDTAPHGLAVLHEWLVYQTEVDTTAGSTC